MHAQPTPPSRNAKFRSGKRRVMPPKKSALQTAWPAEAKWPMWLKQKFDGVEDVVGSANGAAQAGVLHAVVAEPGRGIDDAEIHAEVVEALVHEARQHGRRPIEDVRARRAPERLLSDAAPGPLGQRHLE